MPTGKRQRDCLPLRPMHCAAGFTYLAILIAVAIMGVALAATGVVWHTAQQRDREHALLYVGDQFRDAIGRYVNASAGVRQYPASLDDLLRDPRSPAVVRYLRKIYYDPITGTQDWGLVKDANDRIIGVYSQSQQHPIKQSNFNQTDKDFEGKESYSEWTFIYRSTFHRAKAVRRVISPAPGATGQSTSGQQQ